MDSSPVYAVWTRCSLVSSQYVMAYKNSASLSTSRMFNGLSMEISASNCLRDPL